MFIGETDRTDSFHPNIWTRNLWQREPGNIQPSAHFWCVNIDIKSLQKYQFVFLMQFCSCCYVAIVPLCQDVHTGNITSFLCCFVGIVMSLVWTRHDHSIICFFISFRCECDEGYVSADNETRCADFDECAVNNGGCSQICVNTEGGYMCECSPGYNATDSE